MLEYLVNWWYGNLIEVKIIECRTVINHWCIDHTLVECPDNTRKYAYGHLGKPGEIINVYKHKLYNY